MPDVDKILRLVAEGALSAEEADEILASLSGDDRPPPSAEEPASHRSTETGARRLRIEVQERGRSVVNLSVPVNIASLASAFLPGLSDEDGERIRSAVASGMRGPVVDIGTDDGDRVRIISE